MNADLRKKAQNDFEKHIFKLMNNVVTTDIKFVTTVRRRNYLEPNYHTTKFFTENLLATEMKKTQILMDKPVYFGLFNIRIK